MRSFMPELDVVRGVAVLAVAFYHLLSYQSFHITDVDTVLGMVVSTVAKLSRIGWSGVHLFFVLSGFLITGILLEARSRPHYYRRFYSRRALRILPAYLTVLPVVLLFGAASPEFIGFSLIFLANLTPIFGVEIGYGVLWSLAVEEHFYLVWPTVLRRFRASTVAMLAAGIFLATPIARAIGFAHGYNHQIYFYTWFVSDGLALGAVMAVLMRHPRATRAVVVRTTVAILVATLAALVVLRPFGIMTRNRMLGASLQFTMLDLCFACVIVFVLLAGSGRWKRVVLRPTLMFFGWLSYGLYLWHELIFQIIETFFQKRLPTLAGSEPGPVVLRSALELSIAIVIAYLSRRYLEEYFLRMKDRFSRPPAEIVP
jgi:peptidoglycan/LPS O-acetylase OafA/YrhL